MMNASGNQIICSATDADVLAAREIERLARVPLPRRLEVKPNAHFLVRRQGLFALCGEALAEIPARLLERDIGQVLSPWREQPNGVVQRRGAPHNMSGDGRMFASASAASAAVPAARGCC